MATLEQGQTGWMMLTTIIAQDFPRARERLEDLKRMGKNVAPRPRERFSRSRTQEGDCVIM